MKLGWVAIDGTKIKANASKHKAMSCERMLREEQRLGEEVRRLQAEAEKTDQDEDKRYGRNRRGDELPAELGVGAGCLRAAQDHRRAGLWADQTGRRASDTSRFAASTRSAQNGRWSAPRTTC
jgi:hypothetical protein